MQHVAIVVQSVFINCNFTVPAHLSMCIYFIMLHFYDYCINILTLLFPPFSIS